MAIDTLHMSQDFAGLVIVAIAGNAVENVVGVQLAFDDIMKKPKRVSKLD